MNFLETLPPLINKFDIPEMQLRPYSHIDPLYNCVKIGDKRKLHIYNGDREIMYYPEKCLNVYKKLIHANYFKVSIKPERKNNAGFSG